MSVTSVKVGNRYLNKHVFALGAHRYYVRQKVNHIWIYDRSGSMHYLLPDLIEDLIIHSKTLPQGDTLTVGWFSSEGQFRFILVGHEINPGSYDVIERMVRANSSSVALTCFSDILAETKQVIDTLSAGFGGAFSMIFFTDGYPVVSNYQKEIQKIFTALQNIRGTISASLFVGYGGYYNKTLMAQMAEGLGGILIHSEHLRHFSENTQTFIKTMNTAPKRVVNLDFKPELAFVIDDSYIQLCFVDDDGTVAIPNTAEVVYTIGAKAKGSKLSDFKSTIPDLYAAAYAELQTANADIALEFLAPTGDVALIDLVNGAWTNREFGLAADRIQTAVFEPEARWVGGQNFNYVPDPNAFCVIDVLDILEDDSEARFYPNHPEFEYTRIGVPARVKEGYPKFIKDDDVACSLTGMVWNSKRLNCSLRIEIPGKIELDDNHYHYGFDREFRCKQYRTYTIIRDGVLNVQRLPVSISKNTYQQLLEHGVLFSEDMLIVNPTWYEGRTFILVLTEIPLINQNIAKVPTAEKYCEWAFEEYLHQGWLKVCKQRLDEIDPNKSMRSNDMFSDEQRAYLENLGIKNGIFSPQMETQESVDYYYAKQFEVKLKGLSSVPKVEDVRSKMESGDKLTTAQNMLAEVIRVIDVISPGVKNLVTLIETHKQSLSAVRRNMNRAKFALLLGKKWFPDLTTRDDAMVTIETVFGDIPCTMTLSETKVEY